MSEFTDSYGNLCQRLVLPTGSATVDVHATVDTADGIDVDMTAPRVPIDRVPDEVTRFLLPSRYCPSDLMFEQAIDITGARCPATPRWRRSGRGSPRDDVPVRRQFDVDVGAGHARDSPRRLPRLRPPRRVALPGDRHPGPHGRGLPPRAPADGRPRLVRGLRRQPLVHVRRHPVHRRATGWPWATGATPPTSQWSRSSGR